MNNKLTLLDRIERFLAKHGMSPSDFGRQALKDPSLVLDMQRGRSPSLKTAARVEDFMRGYNA